MSDVAGTLKVMPESPDVDLNALTEKIKTAVGDEVFERVVEEPIGFG